MVKAFNYNVNSKSALFPYLPTPPQSKGYSNSDVDAFKIKRASSLSTYTVIGLIILDCIAMLKLLLQLLHKLTKRCCFRHFLLSHEA